MEKSTTFLSFLREVSSQEFTPKTVETSEFRESQISGAETHERNLHRNQCQCRETCITIDELQRLSVDKSENKALKGLSYRRVPTFLWVSPPGPRPGPSYIYWRKNLGSHQGQGEKKTFWNTPEHSVLLNMACPQVKLFYQSLTYWGFVRAQLTWGNSSSL